MREKQTRYKDKNLSYRVQGAGHCVVLLHGFAEDGTIWKNQLKALGGYKLIIPDLPGSGHSEAIADMTMEGMADAVKHVLDEELFESEAHKPLKVTMIGHSMGGYITLAFAERYSEMLAAFGLFHSTAYADSPEKKIARKMGIEKIRQQGPQEFVNNTITGLYAPETRDRRPELIAEQIAQTCNFLGETLVSYYEGMMKRPDRTKVLTQSALPVLFILGKWDTAVPLEDGLRLCHLPEISYIEILEHSGHMGMREEPDKANASLLDFLQFVEKSASDQ